MQIRSALRSAVRPALHGVFGHTSFPDGAILHFDATLGFTDQTGNQGAVLIGSAYPAVVAGFAVNAAGAEWGFDITTGPVKAALESGEVTLHQVVSLPLMSSLDDATDYSLFGDLLFVCRDGTAGSLKVSDGTNTAVVAYDWSEGEACRVCVQCDGDVISVFIHNSTFNRSASVSDALIKNNFNIQSSSFQSYNSATVLSNKTIRLVAGTNSGVQTNTAGYVVAKAGEVFRFYIDMTDATDTAKTCSLIIQEMTAPFASTTIQKTLLGSGMLCGEHVATIDCNLRARLSFFSASVIDINIFNINAEKIVGNKNNLVSFGDSICATSRETGGVARNEAYTEVFCANRRIPYVNLGVGGETLVQIAARFAAQVGTPSTVIIEGGANDLFNASTDPNATMRGAIESIVTAGKEKTNNIYILNVPILGTLTTEKNGWRTSYNAWLDGYAAAQGCIVVDLEPVLSVSGVQIAEYYTADLTHPNKLGHAAIAAALETVVTHSGDYLPIISNAPCDGILPLSAQPCKSHTLPIGTSKLTVFPGIASSAQIEEAR